MEDLGVFEYSWFAVSVVLLVVWLVRTQVGRRAFGDQLYPTHDINLADVLVVGMLYLLTAMTYSAVLGQEEDWNWQRQDRAGLVMAGGWLVSSVVILYIVYIRFQERWTGFGLTLRHVSRHLGLILFYSVVVFGLTFLTLTVTIFVSQQLGYENVQTHEQLELLQQDPPFISMIILLVLPGLVAPVFEELLFRGLMQNFFTGTLIRFGRLAVKKYPVRNDHKLTEETITETLEKPEGRIQIPGRYRWAGISLTTIMFVMFHSNWQHWPALIVLSMGLGYAYARNGNLLVPMGMHCLFNSLNLVLTLWKEIQGGS